MPPPKPTTSSARSEYLALGLRNNDQLRRMKPGSSLDMAFRSRQRTLRGAMAARVMSPRLLGEDPGDDVLELGFVRLDDLVLLLVTVGELGLLGRREMLAENGLGVGLALVFRGGLGERRA